LSKKPSLHDTKLRAVAAALDDEPATLFRTSVILRQSQKLALEEERLRVRRETGKSVPVTELIRMAIDAWLESRRR
jgi:hypothetical protein